MNKNTTAPRLSGTLRLSCREWLICLLLLALLAFAFPRMWAGWEVFEPSSSFRMPYDLSDDYWLYGRCVAKAVDRFPVLVVGDSVIWGEYVDAKDTLPQCLNRILRRDVFANIGVNGLHPAACCGLLRYYGRAVSNTRVVISFNPLWLHAANVDLTGKETFRFQHPGLVPQFVPRIPCYEADRGERIGRVAARYLGFVGFLKHMRLLYFDNMDIKNWVSENPLKNPIARRDALSDYVEESSRAHSQPVSWQKREMEKRDYPWVPLEESFQWQSFRQTIGILRARKNSVFVLVGPFNPYMMRPKTLAKYRKLRSETERWLEQNGISYYRAPDVASEFFTDASHTTEEGYVRVAEGLFAHVPFRKWLSAVEASGEGE